MNPVPIGATGGIRFDKTITLGNLISIAAVITGMLIAWTKMEGRVSGIEDNMARSQIVIEKQTAILQELQISGARLGTLMDVYAPEIEQMKRDQETLMEKRR